MVRYYIITIVFYFASNGLAGQTAGEQLLTDESPQWLQKKNDPLYKSFPYTIPPVTLISEQEGLSLLCSVPVKKGKLNGLWQSWYSNGQVCDSGKLVNNLPDGEWIFRNRQGALLAIRNYSADHFRRITEEMIRFHPRRNFYYLGGLYQRNRMAALNYLDARYSFPLNRSTTVFTTIRELVLNNTTTTQYQPVFMQCLHEGLYMNFFPGGLVKDSGYYKDGLRTGKWIHRDTATSAWHQGAYYHGMPVKEWKYYDENGRLTELVHYNNSGRITWRKKIKRG